MAKRLRVYISGPYSKGDVMANIRRACDVACQLLNEGYAVYVPHASALLHFVRPRDYADWLHHDMAWLEACDAVLRLPGESPGADVECRVAGQLGIPVVHSVAELARIAEEARDGR